MTCDLNRFGMTEIYYYLDRRYRNNIGYMLSLNEARFQRDVSFDKEVGYRKRLRDNMMKRRDDDVLTWICVDVNGGMRYV